ncbi:IS110 family transposase [Synechocystis sp. PCC 7509]|uniref:IS110 family transposase n=1 Tax=Synechocystis sp. PCC 7509 TaxID=927677 RepID=UPI0002ABE4A1|nr:transposase [Synechocystis sp. PCC 7509]
MRVVGLDVCKNSVVACLLSAAVEEPRQLYYDYKFPSFFTDSRGIKALLSLKPDVAVLEPTGVNYSKFWVTKLAEAGVEIALVGHKQLHAYRVNLDLPDKDDSADALALACYYLEHQKSDRRFVRIRDPIISQIRDIVLRLQHLNRVQSPIINRIRQDLAWQFPEVAKTSLDAPLFWGWLAGERKSQRYDKKLTLSSGLGLESEVIYSAKAICELQRRERALELMMRSLMKDVRFLKYRKVFARFGFGERVEALILSQIYPLENYFGADGKPEIKVQKGRVSGKPTKRHLSRRRFQKALGVAPTREDSGDKKKSKKAGSSLIRMALWQWVFTRIEPKRNRVKNSIGTALGSIFDKEKDQSRPIRLIRSRIASRAIDWLFAELVKELVTGNN